MNSTYCGPPSREADRRWEDNTLRLKPLGFDRLTTELLLVRSELVICFATNLSTNRKADRLQSNDNVNHKTPHLLSDAIQV